MSQIDTSLVGTPFDSIDTTFVSNRHALRVFQRDTLCGLLGGGACMLQGYIARKKQPTSPRPPQERGAPVWQSFDKSKMALVHLCLLTCKGWWR